MDWESLSNILAIKRETIVDIAKKAALPLSIIPLLWMLLLRRSSLTGKKKVVTKKPIEEEEDVPYSMANLALPRLYGFKLKFFLKLSNSIFGRTFLVPMSSKMSNLHVFRNLELPEKLTLYPVKTAKVKAIDVDEGKLNLDLFSFLKERENIKEDGFQFNSISDYIFAYRAGKVTPLDVAQQVISALEAMDKMNPSVNVISQSNKQDIIKMAEASTARWKNDSPLTIFDGIPVAAKDSVAIAGYNCRNGTPFLGETVETEETEATLIKKLRHGGAVIIGATNMHQLGMGITGCNGSRLHGTSRNPYNLDYFCGGSSSGSGAAVASGLVPMAIGVDGGGSIRIPAACCGVVGVKASYERISSSGAFSFSNTVGYLGPLCPTVRDAAISYAFLAGPDPLSQLSLEQSPVSLDDFENTNLAGIKIGIDWTYFKHGDPLVVNICTRAVKFLEEECKAEVVDISIPDLEETRVAHFLTIVSEMTACAAKMRAENYDELMYDSRIGFLCGDEVLAQDYIMAQKQRTRTMSAFENLYKRVDCILTPTLPVTMAKIEQGSLETGLLDAGFTGKCIRYMFHGNLIGIPCLTVPVGYGDNNMPIGLQVMTKWWNEAMMFRVGHAAEQFLKEKRKPELYFDLL